MARTQFIDIPDELKHDFNASIERRDRFILGVAQGHKHEPSKIQKRLLKRAAQIASPQVGRGSLFKFLSPYWRALTAPQKAAWGEAAAVSGMNGWQLFISDNAARIKLDMPWPQTPSTLWQVRAGKITIGGAATEIVLKQDHPLDYLVTEKVPGQPWKQQIVALHEAITYPIDLGIRYKSDLTPTGSVQRARYYARIWSGYQGQDIYTDFAIDFEPKTDWTLATAQTGAFLGVAFGYTLFIEIVGYTGTFYFDNIRAEHGGTNWARDPRCDDISKTFTKAFAMVPPFWVPVSQPAGAEFISLYPS